MRINSCRHATVMTGPCQAQGWYDETTRRRDPPKIRPESSMVPACFRGRGAAAFHAACRFPLSRTPVCVSPGLELGIAALECYDSSAFSGVES